LPADGANGGAEKKAANGGGKGLTFFLFKFIMEFVDYKKRQGALS
jgi:hypothetical protein